MHVQLNSNIALILLFFDDLLKLYQAFGMDLLFSCCDMCVAGGALMSIRYCASNKDNTQSCNNNDVIMVSELISKDSLEFYV